MEIIDEINYYDERMLRLQFEASEYFSHNLTKGEVREDFLKDYIRKKIGKDIKIFKGQIIKETEESSQIDMIFCSDDAIINKYGQHCLIESKYCDKVFEVKSKLNREDLNKLAKVSKKLKIMNSNIKIGLFTYRLGIKATNLFKSFGYIYDCDLETYLYEQDEIKEDYKDIDYILCIYEEYEFLIKWEGNKYILYRDKPIIKYLWNIIKN